LETLVQSAVVAVVISSLVTIAGWYATHRSERLLEAARRRERIQDIQTALLADIRSTAHRFEQIDLDHHLEEMVARIEQAPAGQDYTPFVPAEPGSLLWSSVSTEVHILPTEVIDSVVLFFSQLETVRLFVEDLRSERFAVLDRARKVTLYEDYIRMTKYLVLLAEDAQRTLARSLGLAPPLNSPVSAPSFQSTASGPVEEAKDEAQKSA
jgi:hypothetical protein